MQKIKSLTATAFGNGSIIMIEISDEQRNMVASFSVPNNDRFVKSVDSKLQDRFLNRTSAWENNGAGIMSFTVDQY